MTKPNVYGFLYFKTRGSRERYRKYNGATLDEAARKMARFMCRLRSELDDWGDSEVDYEADMNPSKGHPRKQLDLYELGEDHPIHEFLP
jgi:hypothetical protein